MENEQPILTLFVTGDAPRSQRARQNLEDALAELGLGPEFARTVDMFQSPSEALDHGVVAAPTLVGRRGRAAPASLYGDLTQGERLRAFLTSLVQY